MNSPKLITIEKQCGDQTIKFNHEDPSNSHCMENERKSSALEGCLGEPFKLLENQTLENQTKGGNENFLNQSQIICSQGKKKT